MESGLLKFIRAVFFEGKSRDLPTGEIRESKLFINGTPVGVVSGLTITRVHDNVVFELLPLP